MTVRVDKWLWAVRAQRTRTAATAACNAGRVRVNDEVAKPATKIDIGDTVESRRGEQILIYKVTKLIEKRVGAKQAAECYDDHSPPRPTQSTALPAPGGARERGTGRPTKRDRRQIDKLRGRR